MSTFKGIKTIGFYGTRGKEDEPIIDRVELAIDYYQRICKKKVNIINTKHNVICKIDVEEYQEEESPIFWNTSLLEKAVAQFSPEVKPERVKIFARSNVLCKLTFPFLFKGEGGSKVKFSYHKEEKVLRFFTDDAHYGNYRFPQAGTRIEHFLTTDSNKRRTIKHGYQCSYLANQLTFSQFELFTSKEIDAFDKELEGIEIKTIISSNLYTFVNVNLGKVLIKNGALGNMKQLYCASYHETKGKVAIADNILKFDATNFIPHFYDVLEMVILKILSFVEEIEEQSEGDIEVNNSSITISMKDSTNSRIYLLGKDFKIEENVKKHVPHGMKIPLDALYLIDDDYKMKNSWPFRDSQLLSNFRSNCCLSTKNDGSPALNRKWPKVVYFFSEKPQIDVLLSMIDKGFTVDEELTANARETGDGVFCFVAGNSNRSQ